MSEKLQELLAKRDQQLAEIGGCGDGGCIIVKPKGMHTNGGCRCSRNWLQMQRYAYINNAFAMCVEALSKEPRP